MVRAAKSEFVLDVLAKDEVLAYVLRVHLHLERFLYEMLGKQLPKPERLLNGQQNLRFHSSSPCVKPWTFYRTTSQT